MTTSAAPARSCSITSLLPATGAAAADLPPTIAPTECTRPSGAAERGLRTQDISRLGAVTARLSEFAGVRTPVRFGGGRAQFPSPPERTGVRTPAHPPPLVC